MKRKRILNKYGVTALGIVAGAIAGLAYWHFIGCNTRTCAITANPLNSTLYGAAMGGLLLSTFKKSTKSQHDIPNAN